ncbi:MAG: DUF3488 domain-containing protein, partial [Acidobacteria bacterium]
VAVGSSAAFAAGALGPAAFAVCLAALALGVARARGSSLASWLDRPRLFTWLAAAYLPLFAVDLFVSAQRDPVMALARLVVFIVVAEVLAGDPSRSHRPVLLATLLIVIAAAETTELWFILPLSAFMVTAIRARTRATLVEALPPSRRTGCRTSARGAASIAAASLILGLGLFFVLPHSGGGWGRANGEDRRGTARETGLADEVRLGALGRIKRSRDIVFEARLTDQDADPSALYWRAKEYGAWTGRGWARADGTDDRIVHLPGGRLAPLPPACRSQRVRLVAQIEVRRVGLNVLPVPGHAVWIRTLRDTLVRVTPGGAIRTVSGRPPRRFAVGVATACGSGDGGPDAAAFLRTGRIEPALAAWARSVAPDERRPDGLARAFVRDLARRPYSLDLSAIDPERPFASFLAGAPAHCEYFATAMALGLRLRGVPARVVGGWLGADRVPLSDRLVVRDARAHLWVEVWVPGRGWVPFDPTPPSGREPASGPVLAIRSGWDAAVVLWDTWVVGLDLEDQARLIEAARFRLAAAAEAARALLDPRTLLPAGLAALAGGWMLRRRRRPPAPLPRFFASFLRLAGRAGLVPAPSETARKFAARAGTVLGDPESVRLLVSLYERIRFGGDEPAPHEIAAARDALARLAERGRCRRRRSSVA